eukprot:5584924-Pleurochrysis_carterae.AAC.1
MRAYARVCVRRSSARAKVASSQKRLPQARLEAHFNGESSGVFANVGFLPDEVVEGAEYSVWVGRDKVDEDKGEGGDGGDGGSERDEGHHHHEGHGKDGGGGCGDDLEGVGELGPDDN